jgi:GDSL-like Lipase/Acylhydrolase family
MAIAYTGSSITNTSYLTAGYRQMVDAFLTNAYQKSIMFEFVNAARDGNAPWSSLARQAEILTNVPDVAIFDITNALNTAKDQKSIEALIRVLYGANPDVRIILMRFLKFANNPTVNDDAWIDDTSKYVDWDIQEVLEALGAHYGLTVIDWQGLISALVAQGNHLITYFIDNVHPSAAGHQVAAAPLEVLLPYGGNKITSLPARVYDCADYENTPTIVNGTGYESRTGAGWTDTGTRTQSSTAGDTITFRATCQSFGIYRADLTSGLNVDLSVDGGAYVTNVTVSQNGYALTEARGDHQITLRVRAGIPIRVDQFLTV